jgi:hypothetical protein
MQGVEAATVHAVERHDMATSVHNAARDRYLGDTRFVDGCCHHFSRAFIRQAPGVSNEHGMTFDRVVQAGGVMCVTPCLTIDRYNGQRAWIKQDL